MPSIGRCVNELVKTGFAIFGCERVTFEEIDKAIRAMVAQPDLAPLVGETKAALVWMARPPAHRLGQFRNLLILRGR